MQRNPLRLDKYIKTHEGHMQSLRSTCLVGPRRFIGPDTLVFALGEVEGTIDLRGEIACLGDIVISVDKTLRIVKTVKSQAWVLAERYKYNVHLRGDAPILRYDNAHKHRRHADAYHLHVHNTFAGDLYGRAVWIGYRRWPTLATVIKQVYRWYKANAVRLKSPDTYPRLETRG